MTTHFRSQKAVSLLQTNSRLSEPTTSYKCNFTVDVNSVSNTHCLIPIPYLSLLLKIITFLQNDVTAQINQQNIRRRLQAIVQASKPSLFTFLLEIYINCTLHCFIYFHNYIINHWFSTVCHFISITCEQCLNTIGITIYKELKFISSVWSFGFSHVAYRLIIHVTLYQFTSILLCFITQIQNSCIPITRV